MRVYLFSQHDSDDISYYVDTPDSQENDFVDRVTDMYIYQSKMFTRGYTRQELGLLYE